MKWVRDAVVSLLVVSGLLIGGELAVRALVVKPDSGDFHERMPEAPRKWRLLPGATGRVGGEPLFINSLGMRDREYPPGKPPHAFRIAVLGDSYTFGNSVRASETYPKVLERALRRDGDSLAIEVMNFGVKGYDTTQELATLREVGLGLSPDVIVVSYFLNDVGDPVVFGADPGVPPAKNRAMPLKLRLRYYLVDHSALAGFAIQQAAIALRSVMKVPSQIVADYNRPFVRNEARWIESKTALAEIKSIADSIQAPMLLVVIPEMGNLNELYPFQAAHDSLRAVGGRLGVPVCDLLDRFRGLEAKRLWARYNDPHWNPRAHRMAGETIRDSLAAHGMLPKPS